MWKLAPVRANAAPDEYVIAQDVQLTSGKVVKKFFRGTLPRLQALKQLMDQGDVKVPVWNRSFHWYEVIDESKPARVFVDIETKHGNYERVKNGVDLFISLLNGVLENNYNWMVADASDASKISFHVIGGPLLTNLYHVGALIRRLALFAHQDKTTCADLFDDNGVFIIDEAIYTRGRQFRLFGARKLGSTRVLRSSHAWWDALVNVPGQARDQLEIDGSTPVSTSMPAKDLFFLRQDGTWKRREMNSIEELTIYGFPSCLTGVIRSLRQLDPDISTCDIAFNTHYKSWRVPSRSTCCRIANRVHKSNHVWYAVDVMSRTVHQRCMDEDCAGQVFEMPVEGWNVDVHEPCCFKGHVTGTLSVHKLTANNDASVYKLDECCQEPRYVHSIDIKSRMFRPSLRIWKTPPEDIIFPCEICVFFKKDGKLYRLGMLHAWDNSELRVHDLVPRDPASFHDVWHSAFTGQEISHDLCFNDVQRELLQFIAKRV